MNIKLNCIIKPAYNPFDLRMHISNRKQRKISFVSSSEYDEKKKKKKKKKNEMKKFKRVRILTATSSFQVERSNWGSYGKTAHFSFK